jgi:hypothetical protein
VDRFEEQEDGSMRVVLLDYDRSRDQVSQTPKALFSVMRKVWHCVGLSAEPVGGSDELWTGTEVLVSLLACLGFTWQRDVDLLWDQSWDGLSLSSDGQEDSQATGIPSYVLHKANQFHRLQRQSMRDQLDQLNAFVAQHSQVCCYHVYFTLSFFALCYVVFM